MGVQRKDRKREREGRRGKEGETLLIFMHQELRHLGPYKGHSAKTTKINK